MIPKILFFQALEVLSKLPQGEVVEPTLHKIEAPDVVYDILVPVADNKRQRSTHPADVAFAKQRRKKL